MTYMRVKDSPLTSIASIALGCIEEDSRPKRNKPTWILNRCQIVIVNGNSTATNYMKHAPNLSHASHTGILASEACTTKAASTGFSPETAGNRIAAVLRGSRQDITSEDLVDDCLKLGITPHDSRAFGSVFRALVRDGRIFFCGYSRRRKGHGSFGTSKWRSTM